MAGFFLEVRVRGNRSLLMWRVGLLGRVGLRRMGAQRIGLRLQQRAYSSTSQGPKKEKIGMKQLIRDYGWTATGVYLLLSALDLPITFAAVHSVGQERLEDWELVIREKLGLKHEREATLIHKAASGGKSLVWTELGIAYIIHKSLLVFLRVPITVAITPKVATKLGQWGFKVKRAMPAVDKEKLAKNVVQAAKDSNSDSVRKTADNLAKAIHKKPETVVHDAAAAVKSSAQKSANQAEKELAQRTQQVLEKAEKEFSKKDFGTKPSQRRKWFWFF